MRPFQRVALFASTAAIFGTLAAVGYWLSWEVALVAGMGGIVGSVFGTLEVVERERRRQDPRRASGLIRRRRRGRITADADAARELELDEDDDDDL